MIFFLIILKVLQPDQLFLDTPGSSDISDISWSENWKRKRCFYFLRRRKKETFNLYLLSHTKIRPITTIDCEPMHSKMTLLRQHHSMSRSGAGQWVSAGAHILWSVFLNGMQQRALEGNLNTWLSFRRLELARAGIFLNVTVSFMSAFLCWQLN